MRLSEVVERLRKPLKFVGLSGIGWLIDMAVYMFLVAVVGVPVFAANMVSGVCGATFSFLTANRFVFAGTSDGLPRKMTIYIAYTVVQIILASALIDAVAHALAHAAGALGVAAGVAWLAFLAKVLVTPLLLALNFIVARTLVSKFN